MEALDLNWICRKLQRTAFPTLKLYMEAAILGPRQKKPATTLYSLIVSPLLWCLQQKKKNTFISSSSSVLVCRYQIVSSCLVYFSVFLKASTRAAFQMIISSSCHKNELLNLKTWDVDSLWNRGYRVQSQAFTTWCLNSVDSESPCIFQWI